jgi:adenylyl- and sulfurtransferase ThiI
LEEFSREEFERELGGNLEDVLRELEDELQEMEEEFEERGEELERATEDMLTRKKLPENLEELLGVQSGSLWMKINDSTNVHIEVEVD